jgi:thioredoxin 1|tara:strand:+ start:720 stop:1064 length:345 start_codon:yes stop_codon:yes gene_type:complete
MVYKVIKSLEEYNNVISGDEHEDKLVLAYFTASWCGPCKLVSPVIERIGTEKDSVIVLKVDVDECDDISNECKIDCMPTFLFYKNKNIEPIQRFSGADLEILVQNINNFLESDN